MKVTAYCRVSTDSDQQESSLQNQISYFKREISKAGHTYYPLFFDDGLTGTKLTNRPGLIRMLECAGIDYIVHTDYLHGCRQSRNFVLSDRQPEFEAIWIKNTSRFARNTEGLTILDMLKAKGVYVYFLEQNLNTKDNGDLLVSLFSVLDKQESIDKSNRIIWGYKEKAKQGKIITNGLLFGYDYLPKPAERLVKNEKESKIVYKIFDLYGNKGLGIRKICEYLTAHNMYTRAGKQFGRTTVKNILSNEKYMGVNNSLKYDNGVVFAKHSKRIRDSYGQEATDKIEAIVTPALFNRCQEIMQSKINHKKSVGKYNGRTKYAGWVFCGKCGKTYIGNIDRGKRFYNCSTKKLKGTKFCTGKNISEIQLDKYVEWLIQGGLLSIAQGNIFYLTALAKSIIIDKYNNYNSKDNDRAIQLKNRLTAERTILTNYYAMLARQTADTDSLHGLIDRQERTVADLQAQLTEAQKDNNQIKTDIHNLVNEIRTADNKFKQLQAIKLTESNIREFVGKVFIYYTPKEYFKYFTLEFDEAGKAIDTTRQYSLYRLDFSTQQAITLDNNDIYLMGIDNITAGLTQAIKRARQQTDVNNIFIQQTKNEYVQVFGTADTDTKRLTALISNRLITFDTAGLQDNQLKNDLEYIDKTIIEIIKHMELLQSDNSILLIDLWDYADKVERDKSNLIDIVSSDT